MRIRQHNLSPFRENGRIQRIFKENIHFLFSNSKFGAFRRAFRRQKLFQYSHTNSSCTGIDKRPLQEFSSIQIYLWDELSKRRKKNINIYVSRRYKARITNFSIIFSIYFSKLIARTELDQNPEKKTLKCEWSQCIKKCVSKNMKQVDQTSFTYRGEIQFLIENAAQKCYLIIEFVFMFQLINKQSGRMININLHLNNRIYKVRTILFPTAEIFGIIYRCPLFNEQIKIKSNTR